MKHEDGVRPDYKEMGEIPGTIPKKNMVKKKPKGLKSKGFNHGTKASVPESQLQSFAESVARNRSLKFIRCPDEAYAWIFNNPLTPKWVIDAVSDYLKGIPDITFIKPYKDTNYSLAMLTELKTDSTGSKLNYSQRTFMAGQNYVELRNVNDIAKAIGDFDEFEP
jgi:hypothetical protein